MQKFNLSMLVFLLSIASATQAMLVTVPQAARCVAQLGRHAFGNQAPEFIEIQGTLSDETEQMVRAINWRNFCNQAPKKFAAQLYADEALGAHYMKLLGMPASIELIEENLVFTSYILLQATLFCESGGFKELKNKEAFIEFVERIEDMHDQCLGMRNASVQFKSKFK
jgi:hypothetical protein